MKIKKGLIAPGTRGRCLDAWREHVGAHDGANKRAGSPPRDGEPSSPWAKDSSKRGSFQRLDPSRSIRAIWRDQLL